MGRITRTGLRGCIAKSNTSGFWKGRTCSRKSPLSLRVVERWLSGETDARTHAYFRSEAAQSYLWVFSRCEEELSKLEIDWDISAVIWGAVQMKTTIS